MIIVGAAVIAWFAASEATTEAWYRYKESQVPETRPWPIAFPDADDPIAARERGFIGFQGRELGEREKELLRFDKASSGSWRDEEGNQWTAFLIEWEPDKRLNNVDIAHNPTICLPAAGLELVSELPEVEIAGSSTTLHFKSWEFRAGSQSVFVFTAVRRDREFKTLDYSEDIQEKRETKIAKVVEGQRGNPLQTLQLVVVGPQTIEEATDLVRDELGKLSKRGRLGLSP